MARRITWLGFMLLAMALSLRAVENSSTGTYNGTAPTGSNITNWTTGWTQPATQPTGYTYTTGWNYVGNVGADGGASAVYLGNGWFATATHVASTEGSLSVILNGTTYPFVATTTQ